jgi:hypothetical protein
MSTDIATLGIKIDSSDTKSAEAALGGLTQAGKQAEQQTEQLTQAARVLNETHANVNVVAGKVTNTIRGTGAAAKLTANEALNLSRQFADVGVTAAMGMNPFMILLQQGPQIADIMKTSGVGIKGIFTELGLMVGVLKRVEVATGEVAVANGAQAASALAAAAAEERLAVASGQAAAGAATAAMGAEAAAVANIEMGATATAAATAEAVALAPLGAILLAIAAAAAVVVAVFSIGWKSIKDDVGDVTKGMGLTEKQMDRLKDKGVSTTVTMGDAFKGFFQTVSDRFVSAFGPQIDWVTKKFGEAYDLIKSLTVGTIKVIVGTFVGAFYAIKATWSLLPAAIGDLAVQAANATIGAIEDMVNGAINRINALSNLANTILPKFAQLSQIGNVGMGRFGNPWAGGAARAGNAPSSGFSEGYNQGAGSVDRFGADWEAHSRDNARSRVRDAAGDAEKGPRGRKEGQSDAEKEYERQVKAAQEFAKSLKEETAEIGKNRVEIKMMAVERAAALAPTEALKREIIAAGEAWKKATTTEATKQFNLQFKEANDQIEFENTLLGMNARQRAETIARREVEMRQRALEKEGIYLSAAAIAEETQRYIELAEAKGQKELDAQNLKDYTDAIHSMNDALRESVSGFGELFGTAGQGFENLIEVIADYADRRAELEQQIAEATARGTEGEADRQRATAELAQAHIANIGNMLHASKTFFKEGTTGYKVLEAAERAYRLYQLISTILHIANVGRSIAADTAHTASSVANSGTRATADGIAGVAKAIASLPFPLNLIAGAATLAALVAIGVKMGGHGGGSGASASASDSATKNTGPGDSTAMTSPYSTLPGAGGLYDPKNAGQGGTSPLASANDNSYASNNNVVGSSNSSFVYAPTINAPGADAGTVQQIQDMLKDHQEETVQLAREASAADRAAAAQRQNIGGG